MSRLRRVTLIEDEIARGVARICGPHSAHARALEEMERRRAAGEDLALVESWGRRSDRPQGRSHPGRESGRSALMSDLEAARKAMQDRINYGGPFTFMELYMHGNVAGGWKPMDHDSPVYRLADRMIQFERKRRNISFERIGRDCVWRRRSDFSEGARS